MELDELLKALEQNYLEQMRLNQEAEELKALLYDKMVACRLESLNTPNIKVSLSSGYKFDIPRDQSQNVYQLLEQNGFDCRTYNSTQRTKFLNEILRDRGELPEWLLGSVHTLENNTVKITRR